SRVRVKTGWALASLVVVCAFLLEGARVPIASAEPESTPGESQSAQSEAPVGDGGTESGWDGEGEDARQAGEGPEAQLENEPVEAPDFVHFMPPAPAPPISLSFPELPPTSLDPRLTSESPSETTETADLIKAILGLVLVLALAYIGGMPRI